jgi:hypothetical protein
LVTEYSQGFAAIEPRSSLLAIDMDQSEGDVRFNLHSWAYYHIEKGGWGPLLHAYSSYMPVVFRDQPWGLDDDFRFLTLSREGIERASACYDYVLVWAPERADVTMIETYFEPVYTTVHLRIWRNRRGLRQKAPGASPGCLAVGGGAG